MALVCVTVAEESIEAAVEEANSVDCDVAEIRLDHIQDTTDLEDLRSIEKPVMATCMPVWEGGRFSGEESDRILLLESALDYCDYVSIELATEPGLRDGLISYAKGKGVKVVIAFHDFEKTPAIDEILTTLREEAGARADIAKVAYMPADKKDVLTLMNALLEFNEIPVIALSMGDVGRISRVMAHPLGAYLTFGCAKAGKEAAPGQLPVDELIKLRELLM